MKKIVLISFLCIITLPGCKKTGIGEHFNEIRDIDYSLFAGMEISRTDSRHVVMECDGYRFSLRHGRTDVSVIKWAETLSRDSVVVLPFYDILRYERALSVFSEISARTLRVDKNENVFMEILWNDKYIYRFIRVQPRFSIDEVLTAMSLPKEQFTSCGGSWHMYRNLVL